MMTIWDLVDKAGRKTFGRANAGKLSVSARNVRIVAAVVGTTIFITSIVLSGGTALPAWVLASLGAVMVVNAVAIPFSWMGNHMKILQYRDAQTMLLDDIQALCKITHANGEPLDTSLSERLMETSRKASDINGIAGTVLSGVSGLATIGLFTPAAPIAAGVMIGSRVSAAISAGVATPITRYRINVNKKKLAELHQYYIKTSRMVSEPHANTCEAVVNQLFVNLNIVNKGYLNEWLHFYLYKALFSSSFLSQNDFITEPLLAILSNIIQPLLIEKNGTMKVSKKAMEKIDSQEHAYTKDRKSFLKIDRNKVATIDAMDILVQKINDSINSRTCPVYIHQEATTPNKNKHRRRHRHHSSAKNKPSALRRNSLLNHQANRNNGDRVELDLTAAPLIIHRK